MRHDCEVNTARKATSPDDPRYRPCGKPACIRGEGGTWMCAQHYDEHEAHLNRYNRDDESLEGLGR